MWLPTRPPSSGLLTLYSATVLRSLALRNRYVSIPYQFEFSAEVRGLVGQDRRRPLDGVDLRHHRRVDQPGDVEQPVVVPVGVAPPSAGRRSRCARARTGCAASPARPTSCGRTRSPRCPSDRVGSVPSSVMRSLPSTPLRRRSCVRLVAAVDLRAVPPVRHLVDERDRRLLARRLAGRVGLRAADEHRSTAGTAARAGSSSASGTSIELGGQVVAVVDPVVVLELDPRRGQQVEERDLGHRARRGSAACG